LTHDISELKSGYLIVFYVTADVNLLGDSFFDFCSLFEWGLRKYGVDKEDKA